MNGILYPPRPYPPSPWWMLVTLVSPEMVVKYGKIALKHLKDTRGKAKELGRENRTSWDKFRKDK